MTLFKKILVPVDGSRYSLDAVCLAGKIAEIHGSRLKLMHVIDALIVEHLQRFSDKTPQSIRDELRHQAYGFIEDMEKELATHNIHPEILITAGVPHEAILHEAAVWGAELIVMGKLGRRGISHIVIGSVTERVIEFAEISVLVVK